MRLFVYQLVLGTILSISPNIQHAQDHSRTSNEVGEMSDGETPSRRTKWTVKMNSDLVDARKEAEVFYSSNECPRKENGKKIGVMDLTKRFWNAKGYSGLCKTSQNLRDQYSRIIKAGNQPEQVLNELRNQSTTTTTTRQSETPIIVHGHQPEQDLNEPRNPNTSTTIDPENNGNQNTMENIEQQDEPEYIALKTLQEDGLRSQNHKKDEPQATKTSKSLVTSQHHSLDKTLNQTRANSFGSTTVQCIQLVLHGKSILKKKPNERKIMKKPKWLREIDAKITNIRKKLSQTTEEVKRIRTNGKLTPKLKKNRQWMIKQVKKPN